MIGAVIFTALASRLWLWLLKSVSDQRSRILSAHGASFISVNLLRLWAAPEFTTSEHIAAVVVYAISQTGWLLLDLRRFGKRGSV
jgi:hypothetical protein